MGLFSSGKNPADKAMPYLNQVPGVAHENLDPWASQGQQAQQSNQQQYNQMSQNPADFLSQLRASYSPSEGYKFKQDQYRKAMEGSAAAGGRTGTHADQLAQAKLAQSLLAEDEGAYLDRLFQTLGMGQQGNEAIANRGYGAAGDLTNILGSNLGAQAGLAYKGQENKNASRQALINNIIKGLGGAAAGFMTGGPIGAVAGGLGGLGGNSFKESFPTNEQMSGANIWGGR